MAKEHGTMSENTVWLHNNDKSQPTKLTFTVRQQVKRCAINNHICAHNIIIILHTKYAKKESPLHDVNYMSEKHWYFDRDYSTILNPIYFHNAHFWQKLALLMDFQYNMFSNQLLFLAQPVEVCNCDQLKSCYYSDIYKSAENVQFRGTNVQYIYL